MRSAFDRLWFRTCVNIANEEMRAKFESLGQGSRYTDEQKAFAFAFIEELGIRATSRMLKMPRRTLQRWCRKHKVHVKRCPDWVYEWAARRRRRNAFWQSRDCF
jgi:hypothetical protein